MDTNEAGGGALAIGFLLIIVVLYRDPASAVQAATAGPASLMYFAVLPVVGLLAGIYAYAGGPYSAPPVFLLGSYLGVFALALLVGNALAGGSIGLLAAVGLVLLTLALVAIVASVLQAFPSVGLDAVLSGLD